MREAELNAVMLTYVCLKILLHALSAECQVVIGISDNFKPSKTRREFNQFCCLQDFCNLCTKICFQLVFSLEIDFVELTQRLFYCT
jgi:hypothetical protein